MLARRLVERHRLTLGIDAISNLGGGSQTVATGERSLRYIAE